ncbi:hypothetical protein [Vibrio phage vB_pir03]|nr:hypothetical protein [Vibrio phage vB_pir03]
MSLSPKPKLKRGQDLYNWIDLGYKKHPKQISLF